VGGALFPVSAWTPGLRRRVERIAYRALAGVGNPAREVAQDGQYAWHLRRQMTEAEDAGIVDPRKLLARGAA
jgi:hypothetical protein